MSVRAYAKANSSSPRAKHPPTTMAIRFVHSRHPEDHLPGSRVRLAPPPLPPLPLPLPPPLGPWALPAFLARSSPARPCPGHGSRRFAVEEGFAEDLLPPDRPLPDRPLRCP